MAAPEFVIVYAGLLLVAAAVSLAGNFITFFGGPVQDTAALEMPADVAGRARLLLSCIITGFVEEYVFRAFLPERMVKLGARRAAAIAFSAAIFAYFHAWEGIYGMYNALISAFWLAFWYERRRNIYVIAPAHAAYNFTAYIAAAL